MTPLGINIQHTLTKGRNYYQSSFLISALDLIVPNVNCWGLSVGALFEIMKNVEQRATSLIQPNPIDFVCCLYYPLTHQERACSSEKPHDKLVTVSLLSSIVLEVDGKRINSTVYLFLFDSF